VISTQALAFRESEIQKEVLAKHKQFVVLSAFCRIAGMEKSGIDTIDLVTFFRDNGLVVSEADCYMLVKKFDSNNDGLISLGDLVSILCPRSYSFKRNLKGTQNYFNYGARDTQLTHDIEFAVMQVL